MHPESQLLLLSVNMHNYPVLGDLYMFYAIVGCRVFENVDLFSTLCPGNWWISSGLKGKCICLQWLSTIRCQPREDRIDISQMKRISSYSSLSFLEPRM